MGYYLPSLVLDVVMGANNKVTPILIVMKYLEDVRFALVMGKKVQWPAELVTFLSVSMPLFVNILRAALMCCSSKIAVLI